jgi:hypothetical protein
MGTNNRLRWEFLGCSRRHRFKSVLSIKPN